MREWLLVIAWIVALKLVQVVLARIPLSFFARRKILHILVGFSVIPLTRGIHDWYVALVPILMILSANAISNLKGIPPRSPLYRAYIILGVLMPLALLLFLWRQGRAQTIVVAVLMMTLGDAAAAIGGRFWGRHRIFQQKKTVEGSLCNFLVSFTTVFIATRSAVTSMAAAFTAATIEATVPGIWDNPTVLFAALLLLYYFKAVQ